jgi:hypothetical protein
VENNLSLKKNFQLVNGISPLPRRDRMINVEP